jgi:diguanylate cyclase (GGDEF)-like protein
VYQQYGHYYLCQAQFTWLKAISDSAIAFAYYLLPIMIVDFARKRQDFLFKCIYLANINLIAINSTYIFIEAWMFWRSEYWLLGLLKAITASSSVCVVILLMRSLPQFLTIPNLTELKQANQQLELEITQRKQAEAALQQANKQLSSWVQQLEQRNHEIALLSQMSDILQACLTVEEAYKVIAQLIQPLFLETSGGVFIISSSKHLVEAVTTWGDSTIASKTVFSAKQCWALRRGRSHLSTSDHQGLHCSHIEESFVGEALCVPMMAQGEALGMLHFHFPQKGQLTIAKQQLASAVAERIALALANLRLTEALQQQSIRDPLTGLFNRRYLEESLEREISRAERSHKHVGIIMMDVDHFKSFNDKFGHEAGDVVLRELGGFLKKQVRKADIACRYGGEEIMLILPESSLEVCQERAERIRQTVKLLNLQHQRQKLGGISLSLGVAMYPEHGLTGTAVIEAADTALYIAKKTGRDRVVMAQSQVIDTLRSEETQILWRC